MPDTSTDPWEQAAQQLRSAGQAPTATTPAPTTTDTTGAPTTTGATDPWEAAATELRSQPPSAGGTGLPEQGILPTVKQWWDQVNPWAQVKGAAQMTRHPIDTVQGILDQNTRILNEAATSAQNAWNTPWSQPLEKAAHSADAVRHGLMYLLNSAPGVGALLDQAGNKWQAHDYSGATADTAALATYILEGKFLEGRLPSAAETIQQLKQAPKTIPETVRQTATAAAKVPGAVGAGVRAAAPDVTIGGAKIAAGMGMGEILPGSGGELGRLALMYPGLRQVYRGFGKGAAAAGEAWRAPTTTGVTVPSSLIPEPEVPPLARTPQWTGPQPPPRPADYDQMTGAQQEAVDDLIAQRQQEAQARRQAMQQPAAPPPQPRTPIWQQRAAGGAETPPEEPLPSVENVLPGRGMTYSEFERQGQAIDDWYNQQRAGILQGAQSQSEFEQRYDDLLRARQAREEDLTRRYMTPAPDEPPPEQAPRIGQYVGTGQPPATAAVDEQIAQRLQEAQQRRQAMQPPPAAPAQPRTPIWRQSSAAGTPTAQPPQPEVAPPPAAAPPAGEPAAQAGEPAAQTTTLQPGQVALSEQSLGAQVQAMSDAKTNAMHAGLLPQLQSGEVTAEDLANHPDWSPHQPVGKNWKQLAQATGQRPVFKNTPTNTPNRVLQNLGITRTPVMQGMGDVINKAQVPATVEAGGIQEARPPVAGGPGGEPAPAPQGMEAGAEAPAAPVAPVPQKRPAGNPELAAVANSYNAAAGLSPIDHSQYFPTDEAFQRKVADAYDALQQDNSSDPQVRAAYEAFVREIKAQWDHLKANGYTLEPWTGEGQPYANSHEVVADLANNKHLYFFTGGEPHPFLSAVDPETGLSYNDMFRGVHDAFGHGAAGYGFGARGEEGAYDVHSQMFSPQARQAMATETRGQNSWTNFGKQNYDAEGNPLNIPAAEKPFAQQKVDLLPQDLLASASERAAAPPEAGDLSLYDRLKALIDKHDQILRSRGERFGMGIPLDLLPSMAIWGAGEIAKNAWDFAAYSAGMIGKYGEGIRQYLDDLWDRSKGFLVGAGRARSIEDLAQRIPISDRTVSPNPRLTLDGKPFSSLDPEAPGRGYLPLQYAGPEQANRGLQTMWQRAIDLSETPGGTSAHDAIAALGKVRPNLGPPAAEWWNKAFSGPQKERFWYERSAEGLTGDQIDIPRKLQPTLIDTIAATSGGADPTTNMNRALGAINEDWTQNPIYTDLRQAGPVTRALNPELDIDSLKYRNFADTFKYLSGLTDEPPLSVNDVQQADIFGMKGEDFGRYPVMYEVVSRFMNMLRDQQNDYLRLENPDTWLKPGGPQPYETQQMQAQPWVYNRKLKYPDEPYDDYYAVLERLLPKLDQAGIRTPGGKATLETLTHPDLANFVSGTREHFLTRPVATLELGSELTPEGRAAAEFRNEINEQIADGTLDPNAKENKWVLDYQGDVEKADRRAMAAMAQRQTIPGQKTPGPSLISKWLSWATGRNIDVSRIDPEAYGTFLDEGGGVNPNMRIPMWGRAGKEFIDLDQTQREGVMSHWGQIWRQKAVANSQFVPVPEGQGDTYSIFLNRYDGEVPIKAIQQFGQDIGHSVNIKNTANGPVIDINPLFDEAGNRLPVNQQAVINASDRNFANDPAIKNVIIKDAAYGSDYVPDMQRDEQGNVIPYGRNFYQEKIDALNQAIDARRRQKVGARRAEGYDLDALRKETQAIADAHADDIIRGTNRAKYRQAGIPQPGQKAVEATGQRIAATVKARGKAPPGWQVGRGAAPGFIGAQQALPEVPVRGPGP